MNDDNSPQKSSEEIRDEMRLTLFLRQAAAIIAAERGLNTDSRLKLESLAKHQKLPARLFDQAIQQLQENDQPPQKWTRYERAFGSYLEREFAKLKGGVVSTRMEQKAIELAGKKFQIPPHRADQIIAEQAELASVSRVSRSDAELYAIQFIAERIGERLDVDSEMQSELYQNGRRLGLASDQVELEIARRLKFNRSRKRSRPRYVPIMAIAGLLMAAGLAISYWAGWLDPARKPAERPNHENLPVANEPPERMPATPNWMSAKTASVLKEALSTASLQHLEFPICAAEAETRRSAYATLVTEVGQQELPTRKQAEDLICQLFFEEPEDAVAFSILDRVSELTQLNNERFEATRGIFQTQIWANRLLGLMYFYSTTNSKSGESAQDRKRQLASRIQSTSGVSPEGLLLAEFIQKSEHGLAVDQWNYVINNCWASPGRAASIVEPLSDLTKSRLSEKSLDKYRLRILESILELDVRQWQSLRQPIRKTISVCDEVELVEWIELYSNTTDEEFAQFVGPLLLRKADLPPEPTVAEVKSSLEAFRFRYRNRILQPLLSRNERVDLRTDEFLRGLDATERTITPDLVAQVAFETNLNLAITQKIRSRDVASSGDLAELDAWLEQPKIRLRDLISLPGTDSKNRLANQPSAYELNRKNASIDVLRELAPELGSKRELAMEQLQKIVDRFEDISYPDATILARYFLTDWPDAEALAIQRRISAFAQWPTLGLALADQIGAGGVKLDRSLTVARLFFGAEFEVERGTDNWARSLQISLLNQVCLLIENQLVADPGDEQSDWNRLSLLLTDLYRVRHRLAFDDPLNSFATDDVDNADGALGVTLATLEELLLQQRCQPDTQRRIRRAIKLLQRDSYSEMEQLTMANQLLMEAWSELLAQDDPAQLTEIQQLADQLESQLSESKLVADQFYVVHVGVLKIAFRSRRTMVENLLKQK